MATKKTKKTKDASYQIVFSPKPARKVGRPTDYQPHYCDMLIEHMERGLSYTTFSAKVDVNLDTLYEWERNFPEFSEAKKRAFAKCQLFWEELGINHVLNISERDDDAKTSKSVTLNTGVWVFNMKNRFKWTDRVDVTERTQQATGLEDASDDELDAT